MPYLAKRSWHCSPAGQRPVRGSHMRRQVMAGLPGMHMLPVVQSSLEAQAAPSGAVPAGAQDGYRWAPGG